MKTLRNALQECLKGVFTLAFTIKYNWFYILLSVLAPLAIYMMGAGREIIALLFKGPQWMLNTLFLVLSLLLMSLTSWLIPSLAVYPITLFGKVAARLPYSNRTAYFRHLMNRYSTGSNNPINDGQSQIPAKYLAMLPWTMVCATLIQFGMLDNSMSSSIAVFLACNLLLFSLLAAVDGLVYRKSKRYWFFTVVAAVLAVIMIWCKYQSFQCPGKVKPDGFFRTGTLKVNLIYLLSMVATFRLLSKSDKFYRHAGKGDEEVRRKLVLNNLVHGAVFVITLSALLILTHLALVVKLPAVSSLTVLLLCLNFYMLLVDYLFTAQWVMAEKLKALYGQQNGPGSKAPVALVYKLAVSVLFAAFILLVLFNNTNRYTHTLAKKGPQGESLEAYFEKWRAEKRSNMPDTSKPMNVYLISGQGGGSRAAVYILAVLREIEGRQDRELYNQTFSISTISGSSAGIGQYIGQHENPELQSFIKTDTTTRSLCQLRQAYSYNFFNSNLLGLLFYDRIPACIKDLFYTPQSATYGTFNRNYIQEKEELNQLVNFTDSLTGNRSFPYAFFRNNIQDLYRPEAHYATPLVFFNTTVLNRGQKGIFAPIEDKDLFCNNIDLLDSLHPVSFHFAEISSQSFPLLNNFSSFRNCYLGDGGIYENSGSSTTLQIYKHLRRYCNQKNYKVRFIVLSVLNSSDNREKDTCAPPPGMPRPDSKSILGLLVEAISKVPFDGHQADAMAALNHEIAMNNRFSEDSTIRDFSFDIMPQEQFALSRVFSATTLDNFISQDNLDKSLAGYSQQRKSLDSLDKLPPLQTGSINRPLLFAGVRIERLYTQYRNKADKEWVKRLLNTPQIKNMVGVIPPIDWVPAAKYKNEIRYFDARDRAAAQQLKDAISAAVNVDFKLVYVANPTLQSKTPKGQLELWINQSASTDDTSAFPAH